LELLCTKLLHILCICRRAEPQPMCPVEPPAASDPVGLKADKLAVRQTAEAFELISLFKSGRRWPRRLTSRCCWRKLGHRGPTWCRVIPSSRGIFQASKFYTSSTQVLQSLRMFARAVASALPGDWTNCTEFKLMGLIAALVLFLFCSTSARKGVCLLCGTPVLHMPHMKELLSKCAQLACFHLKPQHPVGGSRLRPQWHSGVGVLCPTDVQRCRMRLHLPKCECAFKLYS